MKKVVILSGIPGSGKSAWVEKHYPLDECEAVTVHVSADQYFVTGGEYKFDRARLPEAHAQCLRRFVHSLTWDPAYDLFLVVDNTNTTALEIAPYASLALAYGFQLEIVTFKCPPELGASRNLHGVPLKSCIAMADRLARRTLPPYWAKYERVIESSTSEGP